MLNGMMPTEPPVLINTLKNEGSHVPARSAALERESCCHGRADMLLERLRPAGQRNS